MEAGHNMIYIDYIIHHVRTEFYTWFRSSRVWKPVFSLNESENFKSLTTHFYMIVPPVLVLGILMLSFNLLADGLRDALDPTLKEV